MADGERHGDNAQAEREGNAQKSDADLRKGRGKDRTAAARESEPKRADSLGGIFLGIHVSVSP